jgi:hypothetical protein
MTRFWATHRMGWRAPAPDLKDILSDYDFGRLTYEQSILLERLLELARIPQQGSGPRLIDQDPAQDEDESVG